jgi:hypothetical protein
MWLSRGRSHSGSRSILPQAKIIAVDVREASLEKAKFIISSLGIANVQFSQENLDEQPPALVRQYDAIFCVGLLYHLRQPAMFLAHVGRAADFFWLWTVLCAEAEANVVEGNYRGRFFSEKIEHPLSGVYLQSFQPTIGSLAEMLWAAGFNEIVLLEKGITPRAGPAVLLKAERASSEVARRA